MSTPSPAAPALAPDRIHPWYSVSTPARTFRHAAGIFGAVFLGAVLLVASWAKAIHPEAFATLVEREGLDIVLSAQVVAMLALGLEIFLGAALFLGVRRPFILWPTALLVAFFVFLNARTFYRDLQGTLPADTSCGCFGNLVDRTPAEALWQDLLLMVPALVLAFLFQPRERRGIRGRMAAVVALTIGGMVFAWRAPGLPLDDLATRLKPGVVAAGICAGSGETRVCLDGILPELADGDHLVVLAELDDAFGAHVERLNGFHWASAEPSLWIVTGASEEELFAFRFGHGPAFEIREAPAALLAPLYRTLPRSFRVADGEVIETYSGLPPLAIGD